jgi:hypothetical protein
MRPCLVERLTSAQAEPVAAFMIGGAITEHTRSIPVRLPRDSAARELKKIAEVRQAR